MAPPPGFIDLSSLFGFPPGWNVPKPVVGTPSPQQSMLPNGQQTGTGGGPAGSGQTVGGSEGPTGNDAGAVTASGYAPGPFGTFLSLATMMGPAGLGNAITALTNPNLMSAVPYAGTLNSLAAQLGLPNINISNPVGQAFQDAMTQNAPLTIGLPQGFNTPFGALPSAQNVPGFMNSQNTLGSLLSSLMGHDTMTAGIPAGALQGLPGFQSFLDQNPEMVNQMIAQGVSPTQGMIGFALADALGINGLPNGFVGPVGMQGPQGAGFALGGTFGQNNPDSTFYTGPKVGMPDPAPTNPNPTDPNVDVNEGQTAGSPTGNASSAPSDAAPDAGGGVSGVYRRGGWVPNQHPGAGDNESIKAMGGEFIVHRNAAQKYRSLLEAMNNSVAPPPPLTKKDTHGTV